MTAVSPPPAVIFRVCLDSILLRVRMGLGVSLRSLYSKTFESLHPDLLVYLCDRLLTAHCVWRHSCHSIPIELQFFPLPSLGCLTLLCNVFFNLEYNVCVLFWDGIVYLLLLRRLHFCCYGLEGPFGTVIL